VTQGSSPAPRRIGGTLTILSAPIVALCSLSLISAQEAVPPSVTAESKPLPAAATAPVTEIIISEAPPPADDAKGKPASAEGSDAAAAPEEKPFWTKVPPLTPLPRTGWFQIPPSGPGYYSLYDLLVDNYREKPPKFPYPPICVDAFSFYDGDFRYLDDPNNTQFDWLDPIKRIHFGECDNWLLSLGGEERLRFMHEESGYIRLTGRDNDYVLQRLRLFGDLWYRDLFRVYVEYYDAQITGQDLAPLPIDRNHSDFLNLFADLKIWEIDGTPVYVRGGRQEMYYGSQRLISPLDWANTRRTFQGVKGFWHSEKLAIDAFWVQPVIVDPSHFDSPDDGQQFAGFWTTYKPCPTQAIDAYYLYLDNTRPVARGRTVGGVRPTAGFNVSTIGSRYAGDYNQRFLWDFEGMYQFGDYSNQGISAGAVTTGLGYRFANLPMTPHFWIYNDFASGDHKPGNSPLHGTFNQLFPFGHFYFGALDLVGRQNIDDLNMQFHFYPMKWIIAGIQYHIFRLDSARDALYNAGGNVVRVDPTGRAGTDVGDEIDLFANFHLSAHQDIFLGWSKLYSGSFIKHTTGAGDGDSPELFYLQYSFKW